MTKIFWKRAVSTVGRGTVLLAVPALAVAYFGPRAWSSFAPGAPASVQVASLLPKAPSAAAPDQADVDTATLLEQWQDTASSRLVLEARASARQLTERMFRLRKIIRALQRQGTLSVSQRARLEQYRQELNLTGHQRRELARLLARYRYNPRALSRGLVALRRHWSRELIALRRSMSHRTSGSPFRI